MHQENKQQLLIIKIIIKMTELENPIENTQAKVEVEMLPNDGKISITVTSNGSKLTKADAGKIAEAGTSQHDIWTSVKSTKCDAGKVPDVEVNIHEQYSLKMTKADSGKA